jgi:hypothetical protein
MDSTRCRPAFSSRSRSGVTTRATSLHAKLSCLLKRLAARSSALSRGIRRMEWTFDPLVISNAFLNIHRLGAISSAYLVDFYGVSSSRLQGGLPTDRLLAEWELDSPRVEAIHARRPAAAQSIQDRILVPAPIDRWRASESSHPKGSRFPVRDSAKVSGSIFAGTGGTWFLSRCGRKRSLSNGFPHPGGMKSWFYIFQRMQNFTKPIHETRSMRPTL